MSVRARTAGPFPADMSARGFRSDGCTHHQIEIRAESIRGDVSRTRRWKVRYFHVCVESLRRMRGKGADGLIR